MTATDWRQTPRPPSSGPHDRRPRACPEDLQRGDIIDSLPAAADPQDEPEDDGRRGDRADYSPELRMRGSSREIPLPAGLGALVGAI